MTDPLAQFLAEMSRPDRGDSTAAAATEHLRRLADRPGHQSVAYDALADAIEVLDHCGGTHRRLAEVLAYGVLVHRAGLMRSYWDWFMPWTFLKRRRLRAALRAMRRAAE